VRVLVAGAGIIGVSVADALARRGARVVVLEMRAPGEGASRASAGLLAPYTEAEPGAPLLGLGTRSLALFDAFIARAVEASGRPVEYARSGTLEVALDEDERAALQRAASWLASQTVEHEWLDDHALQSVEPSVSRAACGALLVRTHGFVGVRSLVNALAQSARFHGAVFESPVEIVDVSITSDGVTARAGAREYQADRFVLAAGSWSGRIRIRGLSAVPVRPVRGQLLHLRWRDTPMPARVAWSSGCYTVPWSDGTLLVGATVEDAGFDESTTTAGVEALARAVRTLLPAAAAAGVVEARAGLRPATPDGLPMIGALPALPNLIFATGHYRNGILLAPLTAQLVERFVLDGHSDAMMGAVAPGRFVTVRGA
jgi:glycine oxidase